MVEIGSFPPLSQPLTQPHPHSKPHGHDHHGVGDDDGARLALSDGAKRILGDPLALEALRFQHDLDRAIHHIGRSAFKMLKLFDKFEHEAAKLADNLTEKLAHDIAKGDFDDFTPDKIIGKFLDKLSDIQEQALRIDEGLLHHLHESGAGAGAGLATSFSFSQSISLTVEGLQMTADGETGETSVSYTRIAFSVSTSFSMSLLAGPGRSVLDSSGASVPAEDAEPGIYVDPGAEDASGISDALSGATAQAAQPSDGFVLVRSLSISAELQMASMLVDLAAPLKTIAEPLTQSTSDDESAEADTVDVTT